MEGKFARRNYKSLISNSKQFSKQYVHHLREDIDENQKEFGVMPLTPRLGATPNKNIGSESSTNIGSPRNIASTGNFSTI